MNDERKSQVTGRDGSPLRRLSPWCVSSEHSPYAMVYGGEECVAKMFFRPLGSPCPYFTTISKSTLMLDFAAGE